MRKIHLAAVAALALTAAAVVASPAHATSSGDCADSRVCVYELVSYDGDSDSVSGGTGDQQFKSAMRNNADSWKNRKNTKIMGLWDDADPFHAGAYVDTLGPNTNRIAISSGSNTADRTLPLN